MTIEIFLAALAGMAFVAVLVFALTSKAKTNERLADPDAPKRSLDKDGPNGAIADRL